MNLRLLLAVALGSALGAVLRVTLGELSLWGTLYANGLGSFLIGWFAATRWSSRPLAARFMMDGVCGGFTTFSIFSMEVIHLLERGSWEVAAGYAVGTITLALVAVGAGWKLGSTGRYGGNTVAS